MASPRPVPPYLRVVDESACENDWNSRLMTSADRPMPVSRTENVSSTRSAATGFELTVSTTSPASVNFTALLSRLSMIWRSAGHVADDCRGHVALEHVRGIEMLLDRARRDEVQRRLDAFAQIERLRLDVHAPGLDLREVEDVVDDGQQRIARFADGGHVVVLLGVELGVEQQPAHADHGVHRRADLVAHRRQERALGLVRRLGRGARLLRLAEQPRVLQRHADVGGDAWTAGARRRRRTRPPCRVLCTLITPRLVPPTGIGTPRYDSACRPMTLAPSSRLSPVGLAVDDERLARFDDPAGQALAVA